MRYTLVWSLGRKEYILVFMQKLGGNMSSGTWSQKCSILFLTTLLSPILTDDLFAGGLVYDLNALLRQTDDNSMAIALEEYMWNNWDLLGGCSP